MVEYEKRICRNALYAVLHTNIVRSNREYSQNSLKTRKISSQSCYSVVREVNALQLNTSVFVQEKNQRHSVGCFDF